MPTADQVEHYLAHLRDDRGLRATTIAGYRSELQLLLRRGASFSAPELGLFIATGEDGKALAPSTRNRRLVIVRAFCRWLKKKGELRSDPTRRIQRAKLPRTRRVALGVGALRQVVGAVRARGHGWLEVRDEAAIVLLFYAGLRVSELVRLDVNQVDLEAAVLRGVVRKGGHVVDALLAPHAIEPLERWLAVRPEADSPALIVGNHGDRLTRRQVRKRLASHGKEAGLTARLHPHALRHSHGTALLRRGIPTEVIRDSLSHASVSTTELYLHGDEELLRAALARLPSLEPGMEE